MTENATATSAGGLTAHKSAAVGWSAMQNVCFAQPQIDYSVLSAYADKHRLHFKRLCEMVQTACRPPATGAAGQHSGDVAAGHFQMTNTGWEEVPRAMSHLPDVVILYHAADWPNNRPTAKGAAGQEGGAA